MPCYFFTVVPAPYFRKHAQNRWIKSFVDGVTAAAPGAIAGAAFVLARRALVDIPAAVIAVITLLALVRFKKLQEPLVILAAGAVGIVIKLVAP